MKLKLWLILCCSFSVYAAAGYADRDLSYEGKLSEQEQQELKQHYDAMHNWALSIEQGNAPVVDSEQKREIIQWQLLYLLQNADTQPFDEELNNQLRSIIESEK